MIEATDVPLGRWHESCAEMRAAGYTDLDLLTAVDKLDDTASPGIDVVLRLRRADDPTDDTWLRTRWHEGLRLRSVTDLWPGAAWCERELVEMFGVAVEGFDDGSGRPLRPLLLPDKFEGHPLRKSFVLVARAVREWPGLKDPAAKGGRRTTAPGVPPTSWGPR